MKAEQGTGVEGSDTTKMSEEIMPAT